MYRRRQPLHELALLVLLTGCLPVFGPAGSDSSDFDLQPPTLLNYQLGCNVDAGEWRLVAEADAWTNGGRLFLSTDRERIENHRVPSIEADPDGTSDSLQLVLEIVGDWREQENGATTAALCSDVPATVFVLYATDNSLAGCVARGPGSLALMEMEGVPTCEE